jgi:hypothetical protein
LNPEFPVPILSFGPFLAALVIAGLTQGRRGIVDVLARMVRWRWYAVALFLPLAVMAVAAAVNLPLFAVGEVGWGEVPTPIVAVRQHTRQRAALDAIRAANNTAVHLFVPMFQGPDASRLVWILTGMWGVAAVAVILLAGAARLSRQPLTVPETTIPEG